MRKIIYVVVLLFLGVFNIYAQKSLVADSPEYLKIKKEGNLPLDFWKKLDFVKNPVSFDYSKSMAPPPVLSLCNGLIPIDNTFSIVPFTAGNAPEYRNDDGSAGPFNLPFQFCFFSNQYNSFFINTNGNITFENAFSTFSAVGFPSTIYKMIAPFWADADIRGIGSGLVYYKIMPTYAVIRWHKVGYYPSQVDKLNDFQLIITNGNDPLLPPGKNIGFSYGDMQWTTGSASGGVNGFGGTAATVGSNEGDGTTFQLFGRFDQVGNAYDGPLGTPDGVSWLDNQAFFFDVCALNTSPNLFPIPSELGTLCDTVQLCRGDTFHFDFTFLAPEIDQVTNTTLTSPSLPGLTITSITSGVNSIIGGFMVGNNLNLGYNTISFRATDNGTPSLSSDFSFVVNVSNIHPPVINGPYHFCNSDSLTLTLPESYAAYLWSDGSTESSLKVGTGTYTVTVTNDEGCQKKAPDITVTNSVPAVSVSGINKFCGDSTLLEASGNYPAYVWNTGDSTQIITAGDGSFTVVVTDTFGCEGISSPFMVDALPYPIAGYNVSPLPFSPSGSAVMFADSSYSAEDSLVAWQWYFGDGDSSLVQNPSHAYSTPGDYSAILIVTTAFGCTDTILFTVIIRDEVEVPNAFLPNSDNPMNNTFYIKSIEYFKGNVLKVYDRWGRKTFAMADYDNSWNAKGDANGVYYYVLTLPKGVIKKGSVTVIK